MAKKVTAIKPRDAKRTDVRKILDAAAEHYDDIVTAWERMQDEDQDKGACDDY